ncbi:hypothetical protein QFZ23_002084 [Arthrobacter globiformis]|uniref:DUF2188 domain-containing protein n=1 Tax=Arthrobacter globiformis TaxID=1665 RepID=UPI002784FAAA|nr:DUF2188 domain-containing protein [Arthrobacter globiformis]MDQ1058183.1 hypothetical protein [Arthrobacter globiformis]
MEEPPRRNGPGIFRRRLDKDEAIAEGRAAASRHGAEPIIKNQDGKIAEKDSHGSDPRNIPG